jgi:hypothetical protein
MSDPGLDRLWGTLVVRMIDVDGSDLHARLLEHHRGRGSRGADRLASRQARTAALLGEGYQVDDVARLIGCARRTVTSDLAVLRGVLDPDDRELERRAAA